MAEARGVRAAELHAISTDEPVYRIARPTDPWAWLELAFDSRWDDPQGVYRVLYASSSLFGAFVEVLAQFRPDPHIIETFKEISDDDGGDTQLPGDLDARWPSNRLIGVAQLIGKFVDAGNSASLAHFREVDHLREALASYAVQHKLKDLVLDAAAIRISVPRDFTQAVSRYVYDQSTSDRQRLFDGIAYLSRLGDEFRNWAIFEPLEGALPWAENPEIRSIEADDPDIQRALELLGVQLVGT